MAYYASHYLSIYPSHRGTSILFHGITGAIDEVDAGLGRYLKTQQINKTAIADSLSDEVIAFLEQRGHLTQKTPEEEWILFKDYVTQLHERIRKERLKHGSLMIVPSYYCNLACSYCYQNPMRAAEGMGAKHVMSRETVDLLFTKVLEGLFPDVKRPSQISVNIYGGEPFLERNRPALERIFDYTQDYQMEVSAISNASVLENFLPCFGIRRGLVGELQISFDGSKLHHDRSRITHYGEGTFDRIVTNIHRLIDRGVQITLRANTNKNNVESLKMLWEGLATEEITTHPHVNLYAAAIHNHFHQASPEPLFSPATLTRRMESAKLPISSPLNKKIARMRDVFSADHGVPLNRTHFCMQNTPNAFLVDNRQDIYSCYEEAGNRHLSVGRFDDDGKVSLNDRYGLYQSRHVGMFEPCSRCAVALTCGGGCPVAARSEHWKAGTIFTNYCDSHRELTAMAVQRLFQDKITHCLPQSHGQGDFLREQPYA